VIDVHPWNRVGQRRGFPPGNRLHATSASRRPILRTPATTRAIRCALFLKVRPARAGQLENVQRIPDDGSTAVHPDGPFHGAAGTYDHARNHRSTEE
jgi:hypothetical protein